MEIKLSGDLKTGDSSNSAIVSYNSDYSTNTIASPTYCVTQKVTAENMATCIRVDASTVVNYSLTYSGIKNTKLNLYIGNLFGAENPTDWRGGWSPNFRTYYVNASYKF